jgi:hypothetical protein
MIYPTSAMLYGKRLFIDEVTMTTLEREMLREQKISSAREALQRVRALRETRKVAGVEGIRQHVEDVDGDWLEKWFVEDPGSLYSDAHKVTLKSPVLVSLLVLQRLYIVQTEPIKRRVHPSSMRYRKVPLH